MNPPRADEDTKSHRIPTSDDVEVSTYLEIAEERHGHQPASAPEPPRAPVQPETVVVIDFGGQTAMLIARRVREARVYCELVPHDAPWEQIEKMQPRGIILSGGPNSVYDEAAPLCPPWVFESGLPVLGICYGMQALAHQLGGKVAPAAQREYGHAVIHKADDPPILHGLDSSITVWMSHGDRIDQLPAGFRSLAYSDNSPHAVMGNDRNMFGLQFHPEVVHTPQGDKILENFLYEICGCTGNWTPAGFIEDAVPRIRAQVGDGRVICALSGGVDSAVTAALVHRAVGDQLTCIFVNNGLMRRNEPKRVEETFRKHMNINLVHIDETDRFLDALAGVTDPEDKRKIVGETFIRVFEEQADRLFGPPDSNDAGVGATFRSPGGGGDAGPTTAHPEPLGSSALADESSESKGPASNESVHPEPPRSTPQRTEGRVEGLPYSSPDFIAQGTTYPDVIESGASSSATGETKAAAVIKTHHNVGGLPKEMTFQLVEPLRFLFKDEVRKVGLELGLPEEMVYRQPFPGPGLAIRVIGQVTREKLEALRDCDRIVMDEIKNAAMYRDLWQSFAILTDTRSVGVAGDYRTYGWVVAIRAVTAEDAMTADWARLPHDLLAKISSRIVNEVPAVNRVVYDITSKPPGTIEWE